MLVPGRNFFRAVSGTHRPSENTQATVTLPGLGDNVHRYVATSITATLCAGAVAPAAVSTYLELIDEDSTLLWSLYFSLPAVAGAMNGVALDNLWIEAASGKTVTLRFGAAGGANTFESVSLSCGVLGS